MNLKRRKPRYEGTSVPANYGGAWWFPKKWDPEEDREVA